MLGMEHNSRREGGRGNGKYLPSLPNLKKGLNSILYNTDGCNVQ